MDSSLKFWNRNAPRYARRPIANQEAYRKKVAVTQEYLRPNMSVMEFGCGTGSTALIHAPLVGSYLATDASSRMIDIAREKLASTPMANLHFRVATLDDLSDQHHQFDAVLGLNILHLLRDPSSAVSQVFELLKPGGIFVSNTVCLKDTRPYLKPIAAIANIVRLAPFVKFLSRQELENILYSAGFCIRYRWVPDKSEDVYFLIATKPAEADIQMARYGNNAISHQNTALS